MGLCSPDEIRSATFLHLLTFFEASRFFERHVSHLCPSLTVVNCAHTLRWHCCVHIRQEMRSQLGGIVLRMIIFGWRATRHLPTNVAIKPNRHFQIDQVGISCWHGFNFQVPFHFFQYVICNHPKW